MAAAASTTRRPISASTARRSSQRPASARPRSRRSARKGWCEVGSCEVAGPIPVIDLGPYLAGAPDAVERTAAELRHALTEIGFYFIVNHGISPDLVRETFRQTARFHAQPLAKKLEVGLDRHNVGYLPMKGDTLRNSTVATVTKANLNEALFVARDLPPDHPEVAASRRFRSANRWPAELPGFRETVVEYCGALERLVRRMVRLYARALDLPAEYFDAAFSEPSTSCGPRTIRTSPPRPMTNSASRRTRIRAF